MKKILAAKPSITEKEISYVNDAVANGWGEHCYDYLNRFTEKLREFFGARHAWPVASCHGALHMVLMALGVGPGDEVIVPDITWTGSVFPITWLGAKPVFVDVLPDTWCIDSEKIEAAITAKTRAIIPVHLYGNLADMDRIIEIARKHNLPVIEDAAEAVGSEYRGRKAGGIADFGVISMHGTKTMTAGEGGAILCNRDDLVEKIDILDRQGRRPDCKLPYWVDHVGLKYKMSNIQAALGLAQFERADELIACKREIFKQYAGCFAEFKDVQLNPEPADCKNSYWAPTVVFGESWTFDRNLVVAEANKKGVALRPFFYPVSMLPMYENVPGNIVAYRIYNRGINLPSYCEMTEDDVMLVANLVKKLVIG